MYFIEQVFLSQLDPQKEQHLRPPKCCRPEASNAVHIFLWRSVGALEPVASLLRVSGCTGCVLQAFDGVEDYSLSSSCLLQPGKPHLEPEGLREAGLLQQ